MINILTPEEIQKKDAETINIHGVKSELLMKRAAGAVYSLIKKITKKKKQKILILVGPGNNGGDGVVVARLAHKDGSEVCLLYLKDPIEGSIDLAREWNKIKKIKAIKSRSLLDVPLKDLKSLINESQVIVDGLFGTGLSKPIRGNLLKIIKNINESKSSLKVAIDIPSGLNGLTGAILGGCFNADYTVTFQNPKTGFFIQEGPSRIGKIVVAPIGLLETQDDMRCREFVLIGENLKPLKRERLSHKNTYGHVKVIGSSEGYFGAGMMAASAALKFGAGLSTLILPEPRDYKVHFESLEVMSCLIKTKKNGLFSSADALRVLDITHDARVLVLGPGLGRDLKTTAFVKKIIENYKGPLILDADALFHLSKCKNMLKKRIGPTILTPHPGEFSTLTNLSPQKIAGDRMNVARDFASKCNVYLVLKGYFTVIATPRGYIYINPTGTPAQASAGQGDTLCGMIAAEISQRNNDKLEEALCFSVYLHGLIAEELESQGFLVASATEIINNRNLGYKKIGKRRLSLNR